MLAPAAPHDEGEATTGALFTTPVMVIVVLVKVKLWLEGRPAAERAGLIVPVPCTVAAPALAALAGVDWPATSATISAPSTSGVERIRFIRPFTLAPWAG